MKKILKWAGISLGTLFGLVAIAVAYVWFAGGRILDREYAIPPSDFVAAPQHADVAEGERLARILGCFDGCHGDGVGGNVFNDDFAFGRIVAPDLTRTFAEMSDAEIDVAVRHGIRRDGRSMTVMPSASFHHLSDDDLNDIVAFIRSLPVTDGPALEVSIGPVARFFIWRGVFEPQAGLIRNEAPWISDIDRRSEHAMGKYIAVTVCGECHGMDLRGNPDFTPSLAIAVAYSREDFGRLVREGVPIGGRELDLMKQVAIKRFSYLNDDEVDALYAYLRTLASNST